LRTNTEYNVRLGSRNVTRIAETLGKKIWKGRQIEVISIEDFPGLGRKGILFKGVAEGQAQPKSVQLSPETIDVIRKSADVAEMGVGLSESDFSVLPAQVRAELLKHGIVSKRQVEGVAYYFFDKEKCKPFLA